MKIINKARQAGKTTELIKMAYKENGIIVCRHKMQSDNILYMAKRLKLSIPRPATYQEFLSDKYHVAKRGKIYYIDDVDEMLNCMSGHRHEIKAITLTKEPEKKWHVKLRGKWVKWNKDTEKELEKEYKAAKVPKWKGYPYE